MPTYVYVCEECEDEFEVFQYLKDDPLVKCEKCGKDSLYKSIQPTFVNDNVPKTIGQLAERNTKKASKEQLANIREEHRTMGKKAKKEMYKEAGINHIDNEIYNKLSKATPEQKQKYIAEGKL